MSDRHDLRRQTRDIRDTLAKYDREQLVEILTHVFRTYVLEGSAGTSAPSAGAEDLVGLPFAQVIERLQLRLDLPELQQFEVAGGRVQVRVDGRLVPLEPPSARPDPLPTAQRPAPAAPLTHVQINTQQQPAAPPPSSPGTETRELAAPGVSGAGRMPTARQEPARPPAARATSASVARQSGGPGAAPASGGPGAPAAAPAGGAPAAAPAAARPAAPARPERQPAEEENPANRFNLLEID